MTEHLAALAQLRVPFSANQISKLPKPTKQQTEAVKNDYRAGIRCVVCSAWHHPDVVHLDYVGHAALTDRLLDTDPAWTWEPLAMTPDGLPVMDPFGGMWIKLTVCGITRLGYGHADGKDGGNAIKEVIGDALRNAGMRFGAALDLWHKGELHADGPLAPPAPPNTMPAAVVLDWMASFESCTTHEELRSQREAACESARAARDESAYRALRAAAKKRSEALGVA